MKQATVEKIHEFFTCLEGDGNSDEQSEESVLNPEDNNSDGGQGHAESLNSDAS